MLFTDLEACFHRRDFTNVFTGVLFRGVLSQTCFQTFFAVAYRQPCVDVGEATCVARMTSMLAF